MRRTKRRLEHISVVCAGLMLCALTGIAGGLLGATLAQRRLPEATKEAEQENDVEERLPEEASTASDETDWYIEERQFGEQTDFRSRPVSSQQITTNADTEFIIREKDLLNGAEMETSEDLPEMYIGMNREQFLAAMENYEAAPPLSEKERGFVNLDVLSFSSSRVVVQMNYKYVQPTNSFYIVAINDLLVVYLEDRETVYQYTNIHLSQLPEQLQQEIIHVMHITDEESLYDFLENYTS